jgi:hypothetical protein
MHDPHPDGCRPVSMVSIAAAPASVLSQSLAAAAPVAKAALPTRVLITFPSTAAEQQSFSGHLNTPPPAFD